MQYFDDTNDWWVPLEKGRSLPYDTITDHSALVVHGKLYVAGGNVYREINCSNETSYDFHCYDAQSNRWDKLPPMKVPRDQFQLVSLDKYIYALGGHTIRWDRSVVSLDEACEFNADTLLNVERYDLETNKWEDVACLPRACYRPVATVYNDKILVYGPEEYDDSPGEHCIYYLMVFYPASNTWRTIWGHDRIAGHRQSIITVVNGVCYEIRFNFAHRNFPSVRELMLLDLESEHPDVRLGDSQDQSCIESNEVCIEGEMYAVITFPGCVYKKLEKERGSSSWFHCSNIDGSSASVVRFTFDKLRLL